MIGGCGGKKIFFSSPTPTFMKNCAIMFTAKWCGPCKKLKPFVQRLSMTSGITLYIVDIDDDPRRVADDMQITSLPTVVFMGLDGRERAELRAVGGGTTIEKHLEEAFARMVTRR